MRPLMRMVYVWMTFGLLVTAGIAWYVANSPALLEAIVGNRGVFIGLIIGQLGLVLALSFLVRRLPPAVAVAMFFIYAGMNGLTLSVIFLVYSLGTISMAFVATAGAFAAMSVLGFTTNVDLSRYRTYFIMGLIGLLVAGLLNFIFRSSTFDLLISMFGVFLFTALTAYDTQKIKRMAEDPALNADGSMVMRLSIYGALTLYLDFINLFLYLLRLFGRSR
jgi:FtsH-binding integral membrane protein